MLPIYHDPTYHSSFKEVLYFGVSRKKSPYEYKPKPCVYELLDHSNYRIKGSIFREPDSQMFVDHDFMAFGIMINLYFTRILPIDIDKCDLTKVIDDIKILIKDDRITGADIINTSGNNWHVHVGLNEFMNVRHILPFIPHICSGYVNCCNDRREAVLRVSQKFYKSTQDKHVTYSFAFRKEKGKIEEFISSSDFIFPESKIQPDVPSEKKRTLKLRV